MARLEGVKVMGFPRVSIRQRLKEYQANAIKYRQKGDRWVAIYSSRAEFDVNNMGFFLSDADEIINDLDNKILDQVPTLEHTYQRDGVKCIGFAFDPWKGAAN